jgi:hypothetical protein
MALGSVGINIVREVWEQENQEKQGEETAGRKGRELDELYGKSLQDS